MQQTRHPSSAETLAAIASYQPKRIAADDWALVEQFTRTTVQIFQPASEGEARAALLMVARISAWGQPLGYSLEAASLLTSNTIDRFMREGYDGTLDGSTMRALLRRIGRAVNPRAAWPGRSDPIRRRPLKPPYSVAELGALKEIALQQKTPFRRIVFKSLTVLGDAVAPTPGEAALVRGGDCVDTECGMSVILGEERRETPVRAEYVATLRKLALAAGDGYLIPGKLTTNKISNHLSSFEYPADAPRLSLGRLRTTWTVRALNEGAPICDVLRALGKTSLENLRDLLPYLEPRPDSEYRALLAGAVFAA